MLGTLDADERQLVLADIPGLIEGASAGAGLGHEFLAHVERCRLLVHVLDLAPLDGSDPVANHETVEAELREHGGGLAELPRILALSKADLVPAERPRRPQPSGASGWGRPCARWSPPRPPPAPGWRAHAALAGHVPPAPEPAAEGEPVDHRVYRPGAGTPSASCARTRARSGWRAREWSGSWRATTSTTSRRMRYLEERLRALGVIRALEAAGFKPGDDVEIGGTVFELDPGAPFR